MRRLVRISRGLTACMITAEVFQGLEAGLRVYDYSRVVVVINLFRRVRFLGQTLIYMTSAYA